MPYHHVLQVSVYRLHPRVTFLHFKQWAKIKELFDVSWIKQSTPRPPSALVLWGCKRRGGWRLFGSWLGQIWHPVWSGCGSVAFVLDRHMFLCFWWGWRHGWSQPQTEEDDEVADVEGSWTAVSRGVSVPWKLDQTQDQDPGHNDKTKLRLTCDCVFGDVLCCRFKTRQKWNLQTSSSCLTWVSGPTSSLLHSRAGKAACGNTTHRTGSAKNDWSTYQWS